jgi:hypothetical protein
MGDGLMVTESLGHMVTARAPKNSFIETLSLVQTCDLLKVGFAVSGGFVFPLPTVGGAGYHDQPVNADAERPT